MAKLKQNWHTQCSSGFICKHTNEISVTTNAIN